jgi:hypothetical protein
VDLQVLVRLQLQKLSVRCLDCRPLRCVFDLTYITYLLSFGQLCSLFSEAQIKMSIHNRLMQVIAVVKQTPRSRKVLGGAHQILSKCLSAMLLWIIVTTGLYYIKYHELFALLILYLLIKCGTMSQDKEA